MAGQAIKLVLFAQTPPPFHGQSHMVQQLFTAFGGDQTGHTPPTDQAICCYHVNARFSDEIDQIGRASLRKLFRLFKYCLHAIWLRFRYGADHFYYVPAPALRSAIVRDWLVFALCRPFFRKRIYHWHASGLGNWLKNDACVSAAWLTRHLLGRPDLSIVLSEHGRVDAEVLDSCQTVVIPNGIHDPAPRMAALETTRDTNQPDRFRVLFMSLCTEDKGLFDVLEAVETANRTLLPNTPDQAIELHIAGKFWKSEEEARVRHLVDSADWTTAGEPLLQIHGFVAEEEKLRLLKQCDCLCFPTYYPAESFGLVLVEAMAAGMHIITTKWRAIPEIMPADFDGYVPLRSPTAIAEKLLRYRHQSVNPGLRKHFEKQFAIDVCNRRVIDALISPA